MIYDILIKKPEGLVLFIKEEDSFWTDRERGLTEDSNLCVVKCFLEDDTDEESRIVNIYNSLSYRVDDIDNPTELIELTEEEKQEIFE